MELIKICTVCRTAKKLSEYHKKKRGKYGFASMCKECKRKSAKEYYDAHATSLRGYSREYNKNNKEKTTIRSNKYYQDNIDRLRERARNYQREHRETKMVYDRKYYLEHKAKKLKNNIRYKHKRRMRETENGGSYTAEEWNNLCEKYGHMCLACGKHNSASKLTVDHIVPIIKGGTNNIENLQPLCKSDNSSKGTKTTDYRLEQNMHPTVLSHLQTTRNLRDSITVLLQSTLQDI